MKSMLCAAALALGIAALPQSEALAQSAWGDRVGQVSSGRVVRQSDKRVESRRSTDSYWGDRVAQVSGRRVVVRQPGRVVVSRPAYRGYRSARIIEVDWIRNPGHWFKRHRNVRQVTVWYDRDRARYYDAYYPGTREIRIYRVNGRYFARHPASYNRNSRGDWDRYDRGRHGRDGDRHRNQRRRDRNDDRWDDDRRDRD